MVPKATPSSYYGLPILNPPVWKALDIAGYFFLGGLAGASSLLAAASGAAGHDVLARRLKVVAPAAVGLGAVGLVHDLGKPSRFANMLRVIKATSPMSVGSWVLSAYAPAAGVAALAAVTGRLAKLGAAGTVGAALTGSIVSTYTAALISDTAVPAWHDAYREMPFVFAGSSAVAAGGTGLLLAPVDQAGPARRMALIGAAVEGVAAAAMVRRLGEVVAPYEEGRGGRLVDLGRRLTGLGVVVAVLGRRQRLASAAAGAALVAASASTRFGVFQAGMGSATDPRYTVDPQKARAADR